MGFLTSTYFWLIVAILFLIVEIIEEPFGLLFFSIGGILAGFTALFSNSFLLQFSVFVGGAFIGLFFFRKSYLALFRKPRLPTNVSALEGKQGIVEEEIPPHGKPGRVRIKGEVWQARSVDGKSIDASQKIRVQSVDGNSLLVQKIEEET